MNGDVFIGFLMGLALSGVIAIILVTERPKCHTLQIIQEVSKGKEAKFKYLTDEFYFESDSLYVVGDVLKIGK